MKRNTKRILGIFLAALMLLTLVACTEEQINTAFDVATVLLSDDSDSAENSGNGSANAGSTAQPQTQKPSSTPKPTAAAKQEQTAKQSDLHFRSKKLLDQHYEKHGIEMGFASAKEYEAAAAAVVSNPNALHKTEKEDGDDVYYVEASNEFVIVSQDGYIRTYFLPNAGLAYYERQ